VVELLKRHIAGRRIRLLDAFRDFDKRRRGICNQSGLKNALTAIGFSVSPQQLAELAEAFGTKDGMFCYWDCYQQIDEAIGRDIEKRNAAPTSAEAEKGNGHAERSITFTAAEEASLKKTHVAVSKEVHSRGMNILPVFLNYARARWAAPNHVTIAQYWRAMDMLAVRSVSKLELGLLCMAYCDTDLGNEFNYVDFCAMIDPLNSLASANKAVQQHVKQHLFEFHGAKQPRQVGNPYYDRTGNVKPCPRPPPPSTKARRPNLRHQAGMPARVLGMTG